MLAAEESFIYPVNLNICSMDYVHTFRVPRKLIAFGIVSLLV